MTAARERCLVWARRKADGTLYRLADGDARSLKPWAKEHLECFHGVAPQHGASLVRVGSQDVLGPRIPAEAVPWPEV
jgi:hypothetical protein